MSVIDDQAVIAASEVLAGARAAVRRGLAVFPLPIGSRVPEPGWQRLATLDETMVAELLAGHGVGIACRASRIVALDLDVHSGEDGPRRLTVLADRLSEQVPATFTVATPSGGRHLYFRVPADSTIPSSSGDQSPLGPGIDVRGPGRRSGGYLVGPGSVVNGRRYTILHDVPVAPLPQWIADRLTASASWRADSLARQRAGEPRARARVGVSQKPHQTAH